MEVSQRFIEEALSKTRDLLQTTERKEVTYEYLKEVYSGLKEKNPYVAGFIERVTTNWSINPPSNRYEQAGLLWLYLITLADAFGKQEEVNKLEILFQK